MLSGGDTAKRGGIKGLSPVKVPHPNLSLASVSHRSQAGITPAQWKPRNEGPASISGGGMRSCNEKPGLKASPLPESEFFTGIYFLKVFKRASPF